jgi:hypothetical protein
MGKPLTPKEAQAKKNNLFPEKVIDAFNELIAENLQGKTSTFSQKDVVARICSKLDVTKDEVFKKHWLDVESTFESQGWKVDYDRPGFNETYEATFTFTAKNVKK